MIKNIIFDMSEVIISGYIGVEKIIERNTNISEKEFLKRKEETLDIFFDTMRCKYSENEYLEELLKDTNWNLTKDELKSFIRQNLNIPVNGTMEIIRKLKNNYNLILLSDYIAEWLDYIYENNTDIDIFEHKYFSYAHGKIKIDEGFFQYVLEDLNICPNDTIFIDDRKDNVDTAKKIGIQGIIFENAKQLEKELKEKEVQF